nr:MAG TPA: hypothetical protein [Caudoviricetes sp.]
MIGVSRSTALLASTILSLAQIIQKINKFVKNWFLTLDKLKKDDILKLIKSNELLKTTLEGGIKNLQHKRAFPLFQTKILLSSINSGSQILTTLSEVQSLKNISPRN